MNVNRIEDIPNSFYTKLAKVWFNEDWEDWEEITDEHNLKSFFQQIVVGFIYGDDSIIYQTHAEPVLELMKDYGMMPEDWNIEDVRINGHKLASVEMHRIMSSPEVQKSLISLAESLGGIAEKVQFGNVNEHLIMKHLTNKFYN